MFGGGGLVQVKKGGQKEMISNQKNLMEKEPVEEGTPGCEVWSSKRQKKEV